MTEPSQYFKGRTVQEQMNEVIGYVDTRAAEVATTAIASDVAQVHQDMLDADADAAAAAASAAAAAGTLANAVKKTGEASQSIAGNIEVSGTLKSQGTLYAVGDASVGGNLGVGGSTNVGDLTATGVVVVPTPTGNTHAANKKYVDDKDALDVHLAGNEAITGNKTVPLEATGTFSNQIASSNKVKNELDNYSPMMRTTGNQVFSGVKRGSGSGVYHKLSTLSTAAEPPSVSTTEEILALESSNGQSLVQLFNSESKDAQCILNLSTKHIFKDDDDTLKTTTATLWLVAYKDKAVLFLRGTDKNGNSTSQTVASLNF